MRPPTRKKRRQRDPDSTLSAGRACTRKPTGDLIARECQTATNLRKAHAKSMSDGRQLNSANHLSTKCMSRCHVLSFPVLWFIGQCLGAAPMPTNAVPEQWQWRWHWAVGQSAAPERHQCQPEFLLGFLCACLVLTRFGYRNGSWGRMALARCPRTSPCIMISLACRCAHAARRAML